MHTINLTREDIRTQAVAMGWELVETQGYWTGDIHGQAQDAANLIDQVSPEAGLGRVS